MLRYNLSIALILLACIVCGQTVGTTYYTDKAKDKLILINPVNSDDCYLVDNCGFIVKQWSSDYNAGLSAYMDREGSLYRAGRINSSTFRSGGLGGILEKYDRHGVLEWSWDLAEDSLHLHHDFHLRENGNILMIVWELIDTEELQALGRQNLDPKQPFYSEQIIELDPRNGPEIVWQWRAFDHLVQNTNSMHTEPFRRFDINLNQDMQNNYIDWLHINSIDFDNQNDLIILSCNSIDELIVIERTPDSAIAASSVGGRYNKGGDILFRWGNASNFSDEENEPMLFSQHDINFIEINDTEFSFSVFNNVRRIDQINYSTVDKIVFDLSFNELIESVTSSEIQSKDSELSYNASANEDFFSKRMSSANLLDDHWIVCASDEGRIIELDPELNVIWEYINPVGVNQIFEQGSIPFANVLFQANAYNYNFFEPSVPLISSDEKIELNPDSDCIEESTSVREMRSGEEAFRVISLGESLKIEYEGRYAFSVFDISGRLIKSFAEIENDFCVDISGIEAGLYFLVLNDKEENINWGKKYFIR